MNHQNNYYSNAIEILPGLWLGDIKASLDTTFLNDKQIRCVINCTDRHPFTDNPIVEVKYRLPIKDNNEIDEIQKFYDLLDEVVNQIQINIRSYNILVHCYAGKQRSAAVVLAYLIKYGQMDLTSAINAVKSKKPDVLDPQFNFDIALQAYESTILEET